MALDLVIRGAKVFAAAQTLECGFGVRSGRIAELGQVTYERMRLAGAPSAALAPLGRQVPEMAQLAAWNTPLQL